MKFNDAIIGLILIAFAAPMILHAQTFPTRPGHPFGPSLFPTLIGAALILCAAALIAGGLAARWRDDPVGGSWVSLGDWAKNAHSRRSVALTLGAAALFFPVAERMGFWPTALGVLLVMMAQLKARWTAALAASVAVSLCIEVLFHQLLRVPLP